MDSLVNQRDMTDPGDEILRRFRYQHAYGVILAVGMATGKLPYIILWCEQQEDFLAEKKDGLFDAYQIKTRKPELGEWEINDESFWKAIARFVELERKFPNQVSSYRFVSNARFSDSAAKDRAHFSPCKLLNGIHSIGDLSLLTGDERKGFDWLKNEIKGDEALLFSVLRRMELVVGLTDRAFEDELSQRHIPSLAGCESMNALRLAEVREALIARIAKASSLVCEKADRDFVGLIQQKKDDPFLLGKKICATDIALVVTEARSGAFRYLPEFFTLQLGDAREKMDVLYKKMSRGGLNAHYEIMRRRALTAEQELIELVTRSDDGKTLCSQIESTVLAECSEANLKMSQGATVFGSAMLLDVYGRLKRVAETEPSRVHQQSYDLLVGVAGMLTAECKVWWSEPFSLKDEV